MLVRISELIELLDIEKTNKDYYLYGGHTFIRRLENGFTFYVGNNNGNLGKRYFALGTPDGYIVTEERLKFLFENGIIEMYTCGFRFHSGQNRITIDGKTRPIYEWNTHTGCYDDRIYDIELRKYLYEHSGCPAMFRDCYVTVYEKKK